MAVIVVQCACMDFWCCVCDCCGGQDSMVVCGSIVYMGGIMVTNLCAYVMYYGMSIGVTICGVLV